MRLRRRPSVSHTLLRGSKCGRSASSSQTGRGAPARSAGPRRSAGTRKALTPRAGRGIRPVPNVYSVADVSRGPAGSGENVSDGANAPSGPEVEASAGRHGSCAAAIRLKPRPPVRNAWRRQCSGSDLGPCPGARYALYCARHLGATWFRRGPRNLRCMPRCRYLVKPSANSSCQRRQLRPRCLTPAGLRPMFACGHRVPGVTTHRIAVTGVQT